MTDTFKNAREFLENKGAGSMGDTYTAFQIRQFLKEFSDEQNELWRIKAEKWDKLGAAIDKFYTNAEGEYDEENPEREGDLIDIGELAVNAFGW